MLSFLNDVLKGNNTNGIDYIYSDACQDMYSFSHLPHRELIPQ